MSDTQNQYPNRDPSSDAARRLNAIQQSNPENAQVDFSGVVDEVMQKVFEPEQGISSMTAGVLVGGSNDAISAVYEGVLQRLEAGSEAGLTGEALTRTLWPISGNFTQPTPIVLEAMKRRTDAMEELFFISELDEAIARSHGSYISYSGEIIHPEFSWVRVSADNHTYHGITYKFYKQKPSDDEPRQVCDMESRVHISYLNRHDAPNLVSEEYPYFTKVFYSQQRQDNNYELETALDIPDELAPVLSKLAKEMVVEALVEQGVSQVELNEKLRGFLNTVAAELIKDEPDPIRARQILESIGIFDNPDDFRN